MAFIDGYVRGKPARIADNLVRLFPGVYSVDPPADATPTNDEPAGASEDIAAPRRKSRKDKTHGTSSL